VIALHGTAFDWTALITQEYTRLTGVWYDNILHSKVQIVRRFIRRDRNHEITCV
jgi:hypothetical protein